MCGIAGFYNASENYLEDKEKWESVLCHMNQTLSHRGNDHAGNFLSRHTAFSHARLSIRDLISGDQPIIRHQGEHTYAIVYNGEIYNTKSLEPELKAAGYELLTTSDTEMILYAYMYYGPDFVTKLNGIFSFAIWDGKKQCLLLYRDRVGVKPLFYSAAKDFVFASEPKALFCHPNLHPLIDENSLQEIFAIGPARTMGHGIFKGVKEVLPGHYLTISAFSTTDTCYWDLTSREHTDSYADTVEKTSFLVRDAVKRQMVSDVPVCTFLSGGIDSSIVTALACNYLKGVGEQLNTFSFDFTGNDVYFQSNSFQPERDLPYVNIMLDHYHTNHTYLECNEQDLFTSLYTAVDAKDLPGMTDVDASLLFFCSKVKKYNKVALTGECADEIFGGYPWFYRPELMNRDGFPWSDNIDSRTFFLKQSFVEKLDLANYSHEQYLTSLSHAPYLEGENPEQKKRRGIAYLNIKWFMQTLLDRMDRTSMYSGLEARVPFADHRIIEYVFNVPWEMKYQNGMEKALLRDACSDLLPEELLHRKKSPYPKTYHPGYEKLLIQEMNRIIADTTAPIHDFIDVDKLETFMSAPAQYGKPWFGQLMAAPQLLAYFLQINYWMKKYNLSL